jgi:curved DNA-binding protein CbpA
MGNSTSQPVEETYNDYLTKQQRIIMAQQEQINKLSRMNLRQNILHQQQSQQNQQIPSNIYIQSNGDLQNQQNNPQIQDYPRLQSRQNQPLNQIKDQQKLNPYTVLKIGKQYDETSLKKAYIRMALKTHPDKGGNQDDFQKVSIAYTVLLKKLNDQKNNHSHNELKEHSREYQGGQTGIQNVKLNDNFDSNLFNKIYEENKLQTVYDDGYGSWMKQNIQQTAQTKMFNGKFNRDMFHNEFEKYKKKTMGNQIVKYEEPKVDISYRGKSSIMTLGQDKITDFSGECDSGLNYRDYKDAYTNSCLIDANNIDIKNRPRNIHDVKVNRSNVQYSMSEKDMKIYQLRKLQEKQNEESRLQRLQKNDQVAFNSYNEIHKRMIG